MDSKHIIFEVHAEVPAHWSPEQIADRLQLGVAPLVEDNGALAAWVTDEVRTDA